MTAPTPYNRQYSFTNFQTSNPSSPLPGNEVDAEYNAVKASTDSLIANLALIQRSDGQLANQSVGYQQLQPFLLTGINPPTMWSAPGTSYIPGQTVFYGTLFFVCNTANTSSNTLPPSSNNAWTLLANFAGVSVPNGSITAAAFAPGAVNSAALAYPLSLSQTPASSDDSTQIATTAFVQTVVAAAIATFFSGLPTTLPATAGVVWNNGGVVSIS